MQANAADRDDDRTDAGYQTFPSDDVAVQDDFDLWLDLGGSD